MSLRLSLLDGIGFDIINSMHPLGHRPRKIEKVKYLITFWTKQFFTREYVFCYAPEVGDLEKSIFVLIHNPRADTFNEVGTGEKIRQLIGTSVNGFRFPFTHSQAAESLSTFKWRQKNGLHSEPRIGDMLFDPDNLIEVAKSLCHQQYWLER